MVIRGLEGKGIGCWIKKMVDYCVFCCSKGVTQGRLEETYRVIVITIKREVKIK